MGLHFGFDPFFPESPVRQGADLVIQSLHKTLPALTQTALLHVNGHVWTEALCGSMNGFIRPAVRPIC